MRFTLGEFTQSSLEGQLGTDVAAGAQAALRHYARRLGSPIAPVGPPGFLSCEAPPARAAAELDLALDPGLEAALARHARDCGVRLEQLVAHAVFVFLVDLRLPGEPPRRSATAEEGPLLARYGHDAPLPSQGRAPETALGALRDLAGRGCGGRRPRVHGGGLPGRR